jgi:hypothetical protein
VSLKDLAMYINEVKRDNETLKKISEFQNSIENLVSNLIVVNDSNFLQSALMFQSIMSVDPLYVVLLAI